ncbi:MAG: general secretion pathway protein A [Desulfobacteraceae bacterium Eth-SRB2]|nr:MAG: general secretion pathway protein A [Desulfobacteraceae bacterium Eth-SRB2]
MYCNHYKFSEKPFDVTPDPRFLYLTPDHQETLASLIYGIRERRGFITIIGEVGTGKTTLLNAAMDRLDHTTKVAFIFNTDVTFEQMLNMALYEWGLVNSQESLSKVIAIRRLNDFAIDQLAGGGNVVLIVDEAQNLDNTVMENLRLLSNLETRRHKLVQIVLSGQPELETQLDRNELRQLAQRINLRRSVYPLNENHTYKYLAHRLKIAKHLGSSPFTLKARKMIWEYSGGIPRKINMLCDNAFLIGYGLKQKKITADMVQEAARDLKWSRFSDTQASSNMPPAETTGFTVVETRPFPRKLALVACTFLVGCLIFAGGFFLSHSKFWFTRLTGFTGSIKGADPQTVQPDPKKSQTQLPISDAVEQAHIVPDIMSKSGPEQAVAPEPPAEEMITAAPPKTIQPDPDPQHSQGVSSQVPVPPVQFDQSITQELPAKTAHSEVHAQDPDKTDPVKSDRIVSVKKQKKTRLIVVKEGDTLNRIIVQKYGTYDDVILNKVQRQNPKIIDPDLILAGQVIKLPGEPTAVGGEGLRR